MGQRGEDGVVLVVEHEDKTPYKNSRLYNRLENDKPFKIF